MKYIVSWSRGKDSTFMLLYLLENGYPVDEVVCCDTTIEFPSMQEHGESVVAYVHKSFPDIKFTFLMPEHDFDFYFSSYQKKRGPRAGSCGLGWPNPNYIWCRKYLKLDVISDYLDSSYGRGNYYTYIGIAFDEYDRYNFYSDSDFTIYPLIDNRITELMCLHGCWSRGFTFGGLYDIFFRVSCWCCPLQSIKDLYCLYTFFPDLWQKLRLLDSSQSNRFRKDYTLAELEEVFALHIDYSSLLDLKTKVSEPEVN